MFVFLEKTCIDRNPRMADREQDSSEQTWAPMAQPPPSLAAEMKMMLAVVAPTHRSSAFVVVLHVVVRGGVLRL